MRERTIQKTVQGAPALDGAGVLLTRVLGNWTVYDFDPFLMLDSFDSNNPAEFTAGFPWHPHRGIETITYIIEGEVEHSDSMGNRGTIHTGEAQWMTAGSGVLHQEMPKGKRMFGVQLWLNLPREEKMAQPAYFDVRQKDIGEKQIGGATVRVLSGEFMGAKGITPRHIPARILDVALEPGASLTIETGPAERVFAFLLEGAAILGGSHVPTKTAVLYTDGDSVTLRATKETGTRLLLCSARPLNQPVVWGGPIVMNTSEELREAFEELEEGTFIRERAHNSVDDQIKEDAHMSEAQQNVAEYTYGSSNMRDADIGLRGNSGPRMQEGGPQPEMEPPVPSQDPLVRPDRQPEFQPPERGLPPEVTPPDPGPEPDLEPLGFALPDAADKRLEATEGHVPEPPVELREELL